MILVNKAHMRALKEVYFNDKRTNSPSEYYRNWMSHKYVHTIEVMRAGIDIMKTEPQILDLSDEVKENFVSALLFHDFARPKDVDWQTGEFTNADHGVEGAKDAIANGVEELSIIISVMIHNRIDESFILASDEVLEKRGDFNCLSQVDKEFVMKMRKAFNETDAEEKRIILLAVDLVKDADKLANLIEFERMAALSKREKNAKFTPIILEDVLDGKLAELKHRQTFVDENFCWVSWVSDLRLKASKDMVKRLDILGRMKTFVVAQVRANSPEEEVEELEAAFDKVNAAMERFL